MKKTKNTGKRSTLISEREVEEWFEEDEQSQSPSPDLATEDVESKYIKSQLQIVRTTMDFSLHQLKHSLQDKNYINLSPSYQRRDRWDIKKRSQLIESFLMNIPVPPLFLYENKYNQYEVMDGRQRLQAIHEYLNDAFELKGLAYWSELDGLSFEQLPPVLQRGLLRRTISAVVLLAETELSVTTDSHSTVTDVRMVLFRRLNTGGVRLNPQELRNALYPGNFNDMLIELTENSTFRRIWGLQTGESAPSNKKPIEANALYKTMADCELALRFFAIKETIQENLSGSLRDLLDACMHRHQNDSPSELRQHKRDFLTPLEELDQLFDKHPFILPKTQKPSRPLYDALMVARAMKLHKPLASKRIVHEKLEANLSHRSTYDILVGRGNTVEAIRQRVQLASKILHDRGTSGSHPK